MRMQHDEEKMPDTGPEGVRIVISRLMDCGIRPSRMLEIVKEIDEIFFTAAGRAFDSADAKLAFRDLWLGQYLKLDPDKVHVALATGSNGLPTVCGYLVGCWENPLTSPRFASLPFFQDFAPHIHAFSGQLHINLNEQFRSRGVGRMLIEAFAAQSQAAGVPGIHVVTGAVVRNVSFYLRAGFGQQATTIWNGKTVVMLGRRLTRTTC
jgi:GNAT superfamily N-acetyltransferase